MMNFMNRRMGYPEDDHRGVDERELEILDLSGDATMSEPILQGWRAPRPELQVAATDLEDWSKVVESLTPRYFEPGFHWDVLPDGTIAYSDSSGYAVKFTSADGSVTDMLRRPPRAGGRV